MRLSRRNEKKFKKDKPKENSHAQTSDAESSDVDWGAEDYPTFSHNKQTAIFSNSNFFYDSSLMLGGETNPNYPEVKGI